MGSGDCTISAVCWAPLVLLSLYCAREQQQCCRRAQRDITLTLAASLLVRLVWFAAFHDYADSVWQYLLNRLSIMLQCTAVLMLLFIWLNSMTQNKSKFIKYRNISIGLFAIIWLLIIISTCLGHRNYLYRSNLVAIGAVSFTIAFAALCYGLIVQRKMRNFVDDETLLSTEYPKRKRIARRLTLVSAVLSACFAFRAVCFGIAHEYSPNILFPWFYYHVSTVLYFHF